MATTGDTGNGTTVAFSGTGPTGHVFMDLNLGGASLGKVASSSLATTGDAEFIPNDLTEHADVTGTMIFVQTGTFPALGAVQTLTVTFPKLVATNTAADLAGTGFISGLGKPQNIANNTLMTQTFTWTWDGDTGPTFTAES